MGKHVGKYAPNDRHSSQPVPDMTYNVFGGMSNLARLNSVGSA